MGNRFQDPSSSEYSTPSVSASDGDPAPESAPRPNIAQRFARHASDWLRKMAITGAMRNTTADTSCEAYRSYLSEHPTGDHTTSTVEERFRSSSTPLVPPARRAISEGRTRISNSLAVSPHGHAYRDMDYSQDECEVRERGRAYPEYTEPDASASEAHEPYRQQSLYQFDLARSSSPSDNQYFTPMKQYDPFDRSSPNRGNWLLQRPCRHDGELPFVMETSFNKSQDAGTRATHLSVQNPGSFNEREHGSGASTPSSLRRATQDTSTMRAPYFQKQRAVPDPSESQSLPCFPRAAGTGSRSASLSDPFVAFGLGDRPHHPPQQYHEHPMSRYLSHGANHSTALDPASHGPEIISSGVSTPSRFCGQLTPHEAHNSPEIETEYAYGQSVISGPVTQTMTPTTSPYGQRMGQTSMRESVGKSNNTNRLPYAENNGAWWRDPMFSSGLGIPVTRSSRPETPFDTRPRDSSILSPLEHGHPVTSRHPKRPTAWLSEPHMDRPESDSPGFGLDSSSDSDSDFEDMMDIDHVSRTSRRPSDNGRPDLTIPSELNEEQDRVVCAISESRSSDMIGVAAINITLGQVDLVKVVNDDRYRRLTETVWRMPIQPQTFLLLKKVVNQPTKSALAVGLEQNFPNAEIVPLDREHWNESEGWRMVDRFAWRQDIKVIRENLEHNFYVSCAFSALMAYIEEETEVIFRENSLRIKYKQAADTMGLDRSTITSLELFQNIRNTKGTSSTLFGLLNNTLTPQGRRMIRSALLQPSTNSQEITARHEAVEEFSSNEDLFTEVRANLKQLLHIDVERSIPWVSLNTEEYRLPLHDGVALIQGRHQLAMPSHGELQGAEKDLSHILMLKAYLRGVQAIQETLEAGSCTSELCKWVLEKCGRENTAPMVGVIDEGIESDAIYSKAPIDIRNNRLWAIKAEPNGVLEGARQLYRNRTNELHQYVQELTKAFQEHLGTVPELRLANDNHYWLRFQWSDVERELAKDQVPTEDGRSGGARTLRPQLLGGVQIVNGIRRKHHYDCQTLELIQRSSQIQRHADIVTAQSDTFVADLKKSLLEHAEPLLAVNEAIAVLDMVCSFAHLATTQNYVRPIISDNLVFKGARHPIVEARKPNFVPNDVYSGDNGGRFQVVTGGNMSGKSTFIRTIALIQIMAQVGSFVPASYAAIPICDRLFTRLSTEDKPESNLGTFAVEMSEMNMILRQVTKDSMVIVDELGRGTSPKEGLAIALSMTDELIKTGCRVFFATHFTELARVLNFTKRDSVLNIHLSSDSTKDGDVAQISLPHTIAPGPVKNEDYGLDLSRRFLPERVVNNAERVCKFFRDGNSTKAPGPATRAIKQSKLILALPDLLKQAVSSTMDDSALGSYVKKLQTEFTIRMNIAADDDTQLVEDQTDNNAKRPANLPLLEKPSEEELKEWKKKCDEGERRVMHVNMAYTQDKKHSVVDEEDRTYPYKKSKAGDDTASLASQPTPINRGFLIEELRRDACTPIARANPAISGTDTDSIMEDAPRPARMSLPPRPVPSKRSLHRAISITSSSSVYDEDMADIDEADDALTATSERPGPEAYSELVQPLEQFQPLEKFQPLKEWYARQGQTEGSEPREAPTPSSLTGSRFDTQDSLQSVEEDEEVYDD